MPDLVMATFLMPNMMVKLKGGADFTSSVTRGPYLQQKHYYQTRLKNYTVLEIEDGATGVTTLTWMAGVKGATQVTQVRKYVVCVVLIIMYWRKCDITAVTDGRRGRKVEKSSILEGLKPQLRNNNKLVVAPKQRDLSVCFFTAWQFHRVLPSASNL